MPHVIKAEAVVVEALCRDLVVLVLAAVAILVVREVGLEAAKVAVVAVLRHLGGRVGMVVQERQQEPLLQPDRMALEEEVVAAMLLLRVMVEPGKTDTA